MATAAKLVAIRPKPTARQASPLTPELKDFIDRAIAPALVNQYLAEMDVAKTPVIVGQSRSTTAPYMARRP